VGDNVTLECITLENFLPPKNKKYDVVLLQESSQYIKAHTLFTKAHNLLTDNGIVLITDEVGMKLTAKYQNFNLQSLNELLVQASKNEFKLIKQIDLSEQAAPTVDYLLWVIEKHNLTLLEQLNLSTQELNALINSLKEYKQKYSDGHYGYVLLKLTKNKPENMKTTSKDFKIKNIAKQFLMKFLLLNK
jgi:hypothetical protein